MSLANPVRPQLPPAAAALRDEFRREFHQEPQIYRAPGRVNLIGEHTDYNDGFVLPAAIHFATLVAISAREDRVFVVHSRNLGERFEFSLDGAKQSGSRHWSDYARGVIALLSAAGVKSNGANLMIDSDVPMGAGLSSSAAMEVATAGAFLGLAGESRPKKDIALLCQRAEHEFVGTRCGIMDQFISCMGAPRSAMLLDCRTLEYKLVAVPAGQTLLICNSMVKHSLATGEYNVRRSECEQAIELLRRSYPGIQALRDVSLQQLEAARAQLDPVLYRRARHVISENERTLAFADALASGDLARAGELMYASHRSLRDDYEVSCTELDVLVDVAGRIAGVTGARMTGGGFGGCTVNLVEEAAATYVAERLQSGYEQATGIVAQAYVTAPSEGLSRIQ